MALPPLTPYNDVSSPRYRLLRLLVHPLCLRDDRRHEHGPQGASGHTNTDSFLSIVCASPLLSSCPSDRVAGGSKHALRQLRRVLHGVRREHVATILRCVHHPLHHLWQPHINPKQAQPEGERHLKRVAPRFFRHSCLVLHLCFAPHLPNGRAAPQAEPCDDLIVHCCCMPCALCQECRELKARYGGADDRFKRY